MIRLMVTLTLIIILLPQHAAAIALIFALPSVRNTQVWQFVWRVPPIPL